MTHNLLTHFECKQILAAHNAHDLLLKDFKILPALDAHGYLGEYYRLFFICVELHTAQQIELTFFIKSIPITSDEVEKVAIFEKEAKLYATLLKELQAYTTTVWCPKVFYTRSNLIVLEDLCQLGYKNCSPKTKSLTDVEFKSVLRALAALHSSSIIHETKNNIKIEQHYPADLLQEITISPKIAWFTTGLRTILDLAKNHPKYQSSEMKDYIANELEAHLERVYAMQEPSTKYRNVLCHRDPWHSNVLFNKVTKNAILVDYQTVRYCPPAIDVIFALFLNLETERRISKEPEFLEWYFQELKTELSKHEIYVDDHMSFFEFLKSYNELKLFGYLYRAIAFTLINLPSELITNQYKYVRRTEVLKNYMLINAEFRIQMEACIEELLEYVIRITEMIAGK